MKNNTYLNNRIEALENELSKITNAADEVITELKDFKETARISIQTMTEIVMDKDEEIQQLKKDLKAEIASNYKSHKKMLKYKWESEMQEGRFVSSQKVVRDLRAGFKI